ncbi:hypothetical protein MKEN_00476100 [Mycena kentingensis (nom. inval.)]|nr:hypothetical protein MKEN_00476100 [Mycena kentingensis (nom. inval.)]
MLVSTDTDDRRALLTDYDDDQDLDARTLCSDNGSAKAVSSSTKAVAEHLCTRCSKEMGVGAGEEEMRLRNDLRLLVRNALVLVAALLALVLFILAVIDLAEVPWDIEPIQIAVSVFSLPSTFILLALLGATSLATEAPPSCEKGLRKSRLLARLRSTGIQIRILMNLAALWIGTSTFLAIRNSGACYRYYRCGIFTAEHALCWVVVAALVLATFLTYRRAVAIHGRALVPVVVMLPAWKAAEVAARVPGGQEGGIVL